MSSSSSPSSSSSSSSPHRRPNISHGLDYNPLFLPSLRVLTPRPSPHQPIRLLPLHAFNDIHFNALLSHAPDNALFPFLHGLEGTNVAQNLFFATGSTMISGNENGTSKGAVFVPVPKFRGLIWVVCEEDLEDGVVDKALVSAYEDMEDLEDDFYSSEDDDDDDEDDVDDRDVERTDGLPGEAWDMDVTAAVSDLGEMEFAMDVDDGDADRTQQTHLVTNVHMHPVNHRTLTKVPPPTTVHISTSEPQRRPSNASTATTTTCCSSHDDTDTDDASDAYSVSTAATSCFLPGTGSGCSSPATPLSAYGSQCPSPVSASPASGGGNAVLGSLPEATTTTSPSTANGHVPAPPSKSKPQTSRTTTASTINGAPSKLHTQSSRTSSNSSTQPPPLLTSTFRPKDLLRTNIDSGEPEFIPPRVPDGISLRNFGIQVPIYATLSDIVIYSPKGLTRASMALAERFKVAIEKKASERRERLSVARASTSTSDEDGADDLISYNVFILDATASEMVEKLPHLIVRMQDDPVDDDDDEGDVEADIQGGGAVSHRASDDQSIVEPSEGTGSEKVKNRTKKAPRKANTIDFALREKEEMRDLTKASEIISVGIPSSSSSTTAGASSSSGNTVPLDLSSSTTASHWDQNIGQIFLGNSNDVPLVPDPPSSIRLQPRNDFQMDFYCEEVPNATTTTTTTTTNNNNNNSEDDDDPFTYLATNDPSKGYGYDICVECHEMAPFPSTTHLRAADEHLQMLDALWADRNGLGPGHPEGLDGGESRVGEEGEKELPVRPPPNANAIIHLPFPSSPPSTAAAVASLLPFVKFLERVVQPVQPTSSAPPSASSTSVNSHPRRWSSVSLLMPSFPTSLSSSSSSSSPTSSPSYQSLRSRASTTPSSSFVPRTPKRTRPLKVLLYSSDGYTESSVPALCLLMALRGLSLPEAYLELQVIKKRSFFVYQSDLGVLRRVEGKLMSEREQERARGLGSNRPGFGSVVRSGSFGRHQNGWTKFGNPTSIYGNGNDGGVGGAGYTRSSYHSGGRPAANSISVTMPMHSTTTQGQMSTSSSSPSSFNGTYSLNPDTQPPMMIVPSQNHLVKSRPRASTSPWLPSLFEDHQSWFNDPRFDGSFPSRVLPFLYLGNLNHASNAYMLHALGITHVVSVGECALVPPHHDGDATNATCYRPASGNAHFVAGKGPGGQGSLWIEEREGRIKVLDIKGVCDDGIDTLEPQLEPICEWIEKARMEGGQVLVHCRVGVSRSATVTIAYVMKHLNLPLVDAYLIVRSRRLSVLIQPNMRLLYNLCGWEVKLARERAGDDEEQLRNELARTLRWPYLAKEVHSLNEKYLH